MKKGIESSQARDCQMHAAMEARHARSLTAWALCNDSSRAHLGAIRWLDAFAATRRHIARQWCAFGELAFIIILVALD